MGLTEAPVLGSYHPLGPTTEERDELRFYAWRARPESRHARRDRQLRVLVRASFDASRHRYGSPRIHEDLIEQRVRVSRKRVVRLMQEEDLKARIRERFKRTMSDHDHLGAANLLDRQLTAERPNQRWVDDTTEFVIGNSRKLYLAAILDLFSRFVVGWALSAVNDRLLIVTCTHPDLYPARQSAVAGLPTLDTSSRSASEMRF